jgi:hypothetical protein
MLGRAAGVAGPDIAHGLGGCPRDATRLAQGRVARTAAARWIPGGLMAVATQNHVRSRARLAASPTPGHLARRVEIVENPPSSDRHTLTARGRGRRAGPAGPSATRTLGRCRSDSVSPGGAEGLRFICKVENSPARRRRRSARPVAMVVSAPGDVRVVREAWKGPEGPGPLSGLLLRGHRQSPACPQSPPPAGAV